MEMAGIANEVSGAEHALEGVSSMQRQRCQSGEELAEWRSLEQVENGSPSTSPPYWDSDDDGDGEPKPSELYGKYTWKIDKFSQINKRELKSNAFEVGGYKWYILIYPQGCDVCNHLSLFLCVANHDKLLPGWSHFAQFTIAVVNKDPKKSKYSDTLHRFWKKEHDWGWKKFMELSKVLDGFIDADTLVIKAQVQVIRERADQPFRCLDCQYRRELVRVYLTNVEQICRRFVEERRGKLGKLIEDKARWSSFCAFWLGMDQNCRRHLSQEKMELIMKVLVKHFFIEKEVTSTLVMDSLYSGLKALEGPNKGKRSKGKHLEAEDLPLPIICIEKDTFTLVDDVLLLLERAAIEPLPPKDGKGPQNRTKDGNAGEEFNKDLIERDERRLTELGRRTIEIFVLAHIFSKIEIAYQEAVALRKQEELIREEEAAWLAESEQKAKRAAVDKEKKSKKKQKRNNRRGKDKGRDKTGNHDLDKTELNHHIAESKGTAAEPESVPQNSEVVEDVSDVSDSVDYVPEILPPYPEDRDVNLTNWDTENSEVQPRTEAKNTGVNGLLGVKNVVKGRSSSLVDDNSSTCSSDSVPPVVLGVRQKGTTHHHKDQKYPSRRRHHQPKLNSNTADWIDREVSRPSEPGPCARQQDDPSQNSDPEGSPFPAVVLSLQVRVAIDKEQQAWKKEDEAGFLVKNLRSKDAVDEKVSEGRTTSAISPRRRPSKSVELKVKAASNPVTVKKLSPDSSEHANGSVFLADSAENTTTLKLEPQKLAPPKTDEKPSRNPIVLRCEKLTAHEVPATTDKLSAVPMPVISRPMSAPLAPSHGPRPAVSMGSMAQSPTVLARSASAASRLGPEPTTSTTQGHTRCYRNAIIGGHPTGSSYTFSQNHSAASMVDASQSYSQAPALVSEPLFSLHSSDRKNSNHIMSSVSFGMVSNHHDLPSRTVWADRPGMDESRNLSGEQGVLVNGMQNLNLHNPGHSGSHNSFPSEFPAGRSVHQSHALVDEFPHLDIINDLLDDEIGISSAARLGSGYQSLNNRPQSLNRQYSFPGEPNISSGPPLSVSSCRYGRNQVYHDDGFQLGYGATGRSHDTLRDVMTQVSPRAYINGQVDGFMPNQWQTSGSDAPHLSTRNLDNNGYPYHRPEYSTPRVGINGYAVFRPSNGL